MDSFQHATVLTVVKYGIVADCRNIERADMFLISEAAKGSTIETARMYGERFPYRQLCHQKHLHIIGSCAKRDHFLPLVLAGRTRAARIFLDMGADQPTVSTRAVTLVCHNLLRHGEN